MILWGTRDPSAAMSWISAKTNFEKKNHIVTAWLDGKFDADVENESKSLARARQGRDNGVNVAACSPFLDIFSIPQSGGILNLKTWLDAD